MKLKGSKTTLEEYIAKEEQENHLKTGKKPSPEPHQNKSRLPEKEPPLVSDEGRNHPEVWEDPPEE